MMVYVGVSVNIDINISIDAGISYADNLYWINNIYFIFRPFEMKLIVILYVYIIRDYIECLELFRKKPQVFILIYLYFFTILYSQLLIIARLAVCLFLQC